ncbi:MAG: acetyl-CoA carboxylase biotin carboxyl carrier protein subunit [Chloroflexi bacterium]|nr:acetyl-CoA carboxylase biotin carboxyl carrier protein subunit [Chloroflexota bacterium]
MGAQIVAPMPGKVLSVKVKAGDSVKYGDDVLTLEAMKMEIPIKSTETGIVKEVRVSAGQSVPHGHVLVEFQ